MLVLVLPKVEVAWRQNHFYKISIDGKFCPHKTFMLAKGPPTYLKSWPIYKVASAELGVHSCFMLPQTSLQGYHGFVSAKQPKTLFSWCSEMPLIDSKIGSAID